ncbi:DNA-directed RNA polymerase I subunit RPA12 [Enteropsectra breve]|nr:DNA-directed RNA polymerase I subunit RPA12 [Enteropsectra breve]
MFCECGTVIHYPLLVSEPIVCKRCGAVKTDENMPQMVSSVEFVHLEKVEHVEVKGALIDKKCSNCGHDKMIYNTAQLRSADEGQTVFYKCEKCAYKVTVQS